MIAHHRQPVSDATTHRLPAATPGTTRSIAPATRVYNLTAVPMPGTAGDAGRAILTLQRHQPIVEYLQQRLSANGDAVRNGEQLDKDAQTLSHSSGLAADKVRRLLPEDARQVHNLMRPFVIRAVRGEQIEVHVLNRLPASLHLALLDDDFDIQQSVAQQRPLEPGEQNVYIWTCRQSGIYPIYNQACPQNSASRCLLGVLMIEP
jgi:hypothetical protein